jgi:hypothetical protein
MYVLIAIFVYWLSLLLSIQFFPNIEVQSKLLFGMLHEVLLYMKADRLVPLLHDTFENSVIVTV